MPPSANQMSEPQRPGGGTINGPSTTQTSAGGKAAESAPTSTVGADADFVQGLAGQVNDKLPGETVGYVRTPAGDNDNTSGTPAGKTAGFPDAGAGPGKGRQPQSVAGQTVGAHSVGAGVIRGPLPPGCGPGGRK